MTPLQQIEAAIERLTAQRDAAMAGPWKPFAQHGYPSNPGNPAYGIEGPLNEQYGSEPGYMLEQADAELIVTLHRTMEAQLVALELGKLGAQDLASGHSPDEPSSVQVALVFARAINGGA